MAHGALIVLVLITFVLRGVLSRGRLMVRLGGTHTFTALGHIRVLGVGRLRVPVLVIRNCPLVAVPESAPAQLMVCRSVWLVHRQVKLVLLRLQVLQVLRLPVLSRLHQVSRAPLQQRLSALALSAQRQRPLARKIPMDQLSRKAQLKLSQ